MVKLVRHAPLVQHYDFQEQKIIMIKAYYWWPLQGALSLISIFFTLFGIDILVAAYGLKDPISFVMTFFSASFIILISLALFAGFVARMIKRYRQHNTPASTKKTP